ncbi:Phenylacetate-coenzyme A ligase [Caenispirillum salinarum AK4]|uniref:Phenylacetate-coenzyme A ligase n=1 Tax=Caenispirillum salinarum AK4 TaxID=1238182 RepID=K9HJ53_9PROT|nr:AMP-binding protein [Caenispirillum salinarum]EKV30418.1 Phenylacetate-coenzyme A ligase [Caenispirillum salinarum AK4]
MSEHFDALETREPEVRERDLMAALRDTIAHAKANAPYFADLLKDVDPASVTDRAALAKLPVTRKHDLIELQKKNPPFGGLVAESMPVGRVFQSPGPIHEVEGVGADYFRAARALFAAGFRDGDLVHNTFSYHFTPGGWILDNGARALGCRVFPAGVGQTELQAQAVAAMKPNGYTGTPSFLRIILEKARELGLETSSMKKALVSGEALPPSLRKQIQDELGVTTYQCYATADLGVIAYESEALEGMICSEDAIVEIVRPGTGDPVPEGEVGEVVVTVFTREYPLIRFATGDMSAVLPGVSPCGRTNMRIKGWMGRADQTTKVKGMFVHPEQVADVVKRHPEITKARLVVTSADNVDQMTLKAESSTTEPAFADKVAETVREVLKLKGAVELVDPASLPNDGKVISDERSYE